MTFCGWPSEISGLDTHPAIRNSLEDARSSFMWGSTENQYLFASQPLLERDEQLSPHRQTSFHSWSRLERSTPFAPVCREQGARDRGMARRPTGSH